MWIREIFLVLLGTALSAGSCAAQYAAPSGGCHGSSFQGYSPQTFSPPVFQYLPPYPYYAPPRFSPGPTAYYSPNYAGNGNFQQQQALFGRRFLNGNGNGHAGHGGNGGRGVGYAPPAH
jgi:hypothetical protein